MEGLDGIEKRRKIMQSLRDCAPENLGGFAVVSVGDYKKGTVVNLVTGKESSTDQPSSDVLYYTLSNEDKIVVRPSGTEPKIKIYILAHDADRAVLNDKLNAYAADAKRITTV